MSKKEKRTAPVDLPKEYRVVVMHFAKHKSYRVYCKKYGTKKGEEIITLLHDLISSRLQNQEFVFWLDPDTALLTLEKERYRSVCVPLCLRRTGAILFRKNNTVLSAGRLGTRLYQSREQAWRNKTVSYHRTRIRAHLLIFDSNFPYRKLLQNHILLIMSKNIKNFAATT